MEEDRLGKAPPAVADRLEAAEMAYAVATWRAAANAGIDIRYVDDGEVAFAATPGLADENFNTAVGLRRCPQRLPDVLAHLRASGCAGWLPLIDPPWAGATPVRLGAVLVGAPGDIAAARGAAGLVVSEIDPDHARRWQEIVNAGFEIDGRIADAWTALAPHEARDRRLHLLLAELDGDPVAACGLFVHERVGVLGPASVIPSARGRGIHSALIAARAALADVLECDLVTAQVEPGGQSDRNQLRMGLRYAWRRGVYVFAPARLVDDLPVGVDASPLLR